MRNGVFRKYLHQILDETDFHRRIFGDFVR